MARFKKDASAQKALANTVKLADMKAEDFDTVFYSGGHGLMWEIVNVGGGPTPEKPSVTLSVPDPNKMSGFMNIRVADIQACYELWKSRGAEFITEPRDKYGETLCYIRDPDGYIIEVGQSKPEFTYG
jgi:catechol 2,3-dioxygenase-like lactoylglutathione lyase family enzyme